MPSDILLDLREAGYDGDTDYDSIKMAVNRAGRLENIVRMNPVGQPDVWSVRASRGKLSFVASGPTERDALAAVLAQLISQ